MIPSLHTMLVKQSKPSPTLQILWVVYKPYVDGLFLCKCSPRMKKPQLINVDSSQNSLDS